MVATLVLGACVVRRASSSLALGTNFSKIANQALRDFIFLRSKFVIYIFMKWLVSNFRTGFKFIK